MRVLSEIVSLSQAQIVLSSNWRHGKIDSVNVALQAWGIPPVISCTPEGRQRVDQICSWLSKHRDEISGYVVIDDGDLSDEIDGINVVPSRICSNFLRTDSTIGLTDAHIAPAVAMISKPPQLPASSGASQQQHFPQDEMRMPLSDIRNASSYRPSQVGADSSMSRAPHLAQERSRKSRNDRDSAPAFLHPRRSLDLEPPSKQHSGVHNAPSQLPSSAEMEHRYIGRECPSHTPPPSYCPPRVDIEPRHYGNDCPAFTPPPFYMPPRVDLERQHFLEHQQQRFTCPSYTPPPSYCPPRVDMEQQRQPGRDCPTYTPPPSYCPPRVDMEPRQLQRYCGHECPSFTPPPSYCPPPVDVEYRHYGSEYRSHSGGYSQMSFVPPPRRDVDTSAPAQPFFRSKDRNGRLLIPSASSRMNRSVIDVEVEVVGKKPNRPSLTPPRSAPLRNVASSRHLDAHRAHGSHHRMHSADTRADGRVTHPRVLHQQCSASNYPPYMALPPTSTPGFSHQVPHT